MNPNINLSIPFLMECVGRLRTLNGGGAIICAGGAIRDLILGKPVKDLDFFIEDPDYDYELLEERLRKEFSCDYHFPQNYAELCKIDPKRARALAERGAIITQVGGGGGYGSDGRLITVLEVDKGWRGYPCQFIFDHGDDVREEAEAFDFGFCRAWCDDRRLRLTSDFHNDKDNQRMTLYDRRADRPTKPKRIAQLREKYRDWKFRDLRHMPAPYKPLVEVEVERLPDLPLQRKEK